MCYQENVNSLYSLAFTRHQRFWNKDAQNSLRDKIFFFCRISYMQQAFQRWPLNESSLTLRDTKGYENENEYRVTHDLSLDCVGLAEDVANAHDMGINSEFRHYRFASATTTFDILVLGSWWL